MLSVTLSVTMPKIKQAGAPPESTFTGLWPVESRYEIVKQKVGGKTVPVVAPSDLSKPRLVQPDSFPRIAWEFSKVENGEQLLAFAHKFGLLGFARLFPRAVKYGGDPVEWSLRHARQVAVAFEVFHLIRRGPSQVRKELPGALRSIGLDFMGSTTEVEKLERLFTPTGKTILVKDELKDLYVVTPRTLFYADWPGDPLRVAWRVLAYLINDQIRGLMVEVSEDKLRPVFAFDALLQVIYWQLAGELEGLNLRLCKVCNSFFSAKRIDARHCSDRCRMKDSRSNRNIGRKPRRKR